MGDDNLIVADTSPLLNLALIDRLEFVRNQFSTVEVPEQVWTELMDGVNGVETLRTAHNDGVLEIVPVEKTPLFEEFRRNLDVGEAATLAYAIDTNADLVLLDERDARQTARRHGLEMTGVIGILLREFGGEPDALRTELDRLRSAGFWISESLYETAIERARN
ncbi:DUF3368 domain-containing protein [Natrarchaeobaculum aegyptiacum]|uniref:DUF3368 domain-containing protein n=1 Tax=Natrarchaeobaculum aegyptiacum TaxID=745377 RepID=A0A2Z2HRG0_9EURY|nr:DUF3368 domain-containing protein [Natrarchaeobaculum aegyptiacum]ARS89632.1 hypothetical protein B1756_07705 [Natrarchaeobaculum aegyptiacum]